MNVNHAPSALSKRQMLEGSLRCFALGWLALIPILGLPAALLAMVEFRRVIVHKEDSWNAGKGYLICGAALGGFGLVISLVSGGALLIACWRLFSD